MDKDLGDTVIAITGANQGLGYQTALALAKRNAQVVMVCRSEDKGRQALEQLKKETGNQNVELKICDVSSLESVRAFVKDYEASGKPCNVLINNAGVMMNKQSTSADGHEVNFATNTLGTWALTRLMDPVLRRSAPSRVISVTSGGMYTEKLLTENFNNEDLKKSDGGMDGTTAYARDKRRQLACSEWLAQQYQAAGEDVQVVLMHPGWAGTGGLQNGMPGFYKAVEKRLRSAEEGADTSVWLAMQPQESLKGGEVYFDRDVTFKHFGGMGTEYKWERVEELVKKLDELAGIQK